MNARITMARLHLSQPLCRRIRSSIVMDSAASFGDVGNDNYAMKCASDRAQREKPGSRDPGCGDPGSDVRSVLRSYRRELMSCQSLPDPDLGSWTPRSRPPPPGSREFLSP